MFIASLIYVLFASNIVAAMVAFLFLSLETGDPSPPSLKLAGDKRRTLANLANFHKKHITE